MQNINLKKGISLLLLKRTAKIYRCLQNFISRHFLLRFIGILFFFGLLNFISWNYFGIFFIVNVLIILTFYYKNLKSSWFVFFINFFILLFVFNFSATFWLCQVDIYKGFIAIIASSFIMTIPLFSAYLLNKIISLPSILFIFCWLSYEIFSSSFILPWNLLSFGDVLSNQPYLIQWYSITGSYGGTIWFILIGFSIYYYFENYKKIYLVIIIILFFPLLFSLKYSLKHNNNKSELNNNSIDIVVFNQNLESENLSNYQKTKLLYFNSIKYKKFSYLVTPELFFNRLYSLDFNNKDFSLFLKKIMNENGNPKLFLGAEIKNKRNDLFNAVIVMSDSSLLIKVKRKYVPLVEFIPNSLSSIFGHTYYKYCIKDDQNKIVKKYKILPLLCYESLFSKYTSLNSRNTNAIFLLASEDFMHNSYFGKKQYLNQVRLRSIETGRCILKCSSNGYSVIINDRGTIIKRINKEVSLVKLLIRNKNTFYQKLMHWIF